MRFCGTLSTDTHNSALLSGEKKYSKDDVCLGTYPYVCKRFHKLLIKSWSGHTASKKIWFTGAMFLCTSLSFDGHVKFYEIIAIGCIKGIGMSPRKSVADIPLCLLCLIWNRSGTSILVYLLSGLTSLVIVFIGH